MRGGMTHLLSDVLAFCDAHGLSETRFGELALNDKPFVSQLRRGRDIRSSTEKRVRDYMRSHAELNTPQCCDASTGISSETSRDVQTVGAAA